MDHENDPTQALLNDVESDPANDSDSTSQSEHMDKIIIVPNPSNEAIPFTRVRQACFLETSQHPHR